MKKTFATWFHFEEVNILYLFHALGKFELNEFRDFIDQASRDLLPSRVVVVFALRQKRALKEFESEIRESINGRFKQIPLIVTYDKRGVFSEFNEEFDNAEDFSEDLFFTGGKKEILCRRSPLIQAPQGKIFTKPSGNKCAYFIHAGNLLVNHAEMTFIALALLRLVGKRLNKNLERVWVDTIDLYGVITLAFKIRYPRSINLPVIESFGSYSSFREAYKHGPCGNTITVISATTSGNLERDIKSEFTGVDHKSVFTLIATDDSFKKNPVVSVFAMPPREKNSLRDDCPAIRIEGERFSIEAEMPKKVILKKTKHGSILDKKKLAKVIDHSIFGSFGHVGADYYPVFINASNLIKNSDFSGWFEKCLNLRLPANTGTFIFADPSAEELAKEANKRIPSSHRIMIDDLVSSKMAAHQSVVVIATVISHGSVVRDISRRLREVKNISHVVYIIGVATPPTWRDFSALQENLKMSSNGGDFPYEIHCYLTLETGKHTQSISSWLEEKQYLSARTSKESLPNSLELRLDSLKNKFLPTSDVFCKQEALGFTPGFVFWNEKYAHGTSSDAAALMATIFKVLQCARENESLEDHLRLHSNSHRQVLLDPENFFRFNDTMIQAALIRAAHSYEMDYSDDESASQAIAYLIGRAAVIKNPIICEFIMAILTRRMRITKNQMVAIKKVLESHQNEEEIKFFLGDEIWDDR